MGAITIRVRQKGTITLPKELRARYQVSEGDIFSILDLGNGSLLLTPRVSVLDRELDQVARILDEEQVSVDDLLEALEQERETYYRERYAGA